MPEEKRDTLVSLTENLIQTLPLKFGVTKEELIEVAQKSLAARLDSTENDPDLAPGMLAWIYGTRAIRELFRSKGWSKWCCKGVHGVGNLSKNILIIFQNVDLACALGHFPKAISEKGKVSAEIIDASQGELFKEYENKDISVHSIEFFEVWYLCVSYDSLNGLRAELSRPNILQEKQIDTFQFNDFHERIFIIENDNNIQVEHVDHENQMDFDVPVSKKSG